MKKPFKIILCVIIAAVFVTIGLLVYINSVNSVNYDSTIPDFKEYNVKDIRNDTRFDVKKLTFASETPIYTDIGKVKGFKFVLKGTHLRYSDMHPQNQYTTMENGTWYSDTPIYFTEYTKNAEGIIIFDGVPYSLYYNANGRPFVKCLETRFNDYFKEDKTYSDFIKCAMHYERRLDDEDLLSS